MHGGSPPHSGLWAMGFGNGNDDKESETSFFLPVIEIIFFKVSYIRYSVLQCHLAAAFYFKINVASFIFSDLSSDA